MKRLLVLVALAATVTACGGSSGGDDPTLTAPSSAAASSAAAADGDLSTKPAVTVPSGPAPSTLQIKDLVPGTGAEAVAGKTITVKYVGVTYATGKEFDTSWGKQDFTFTLGGGQVIQGWDQGFAGMKVGGRRQLVIPAALAYGDQSPTPDIPPGSTLVFVVDLVKVA